MQSKNTHPFTRALGSLRGRLFLAIVSLLALAACSGDKTPTGGDPTTAGAHSGANAAASGNRASAANGGQGAAQAHAGQVAQAGGTGAAGSASGTSGAGAAMAGAGAAGTTMPTGGTVSQQPTMCNGKPLPPRAQGSLGPFAVGPEAAGLAAYWPTTAWKTEDPAKLGFDAAKLMKAVDYKTQYSTTQAVFIVRHGYVAAEKYVGGFTATTTHESYSMAKSFASGLVGIAIGEGKLKGTDEKLCTYYPMDWDCSATMDPRSRITIDHAMNLETGLVWSENWRSTYTGTNDAYNLNLLDTVLSRQSAEEPGKTKRYSTGDPALLSGVLQKATGMTAFAYGKQKVFDVIGAKSISWNTDTAGRTTTYAGLQATAADYARYGYLYLQHGKWDGKQVVPSDWVDRTTRGPKPCEDWYEYLWHINLPVRLGTQPANCTDFYCAPTDLANLPPDAFLAEGVNGQFVFIVPSADLVAVRLGNDMAGSEHWDEFSLGFLAALLDAIP